MLSVSLPSFLMLLDGIFGRYPGSDVNLLINVKSLAVDALQRMSSHFTTNSNPAGLLHDLLRYFQLEHIAPTMLTSSFTVSSCEAILTSISKQVQEDVATLRRINRVTGSMGINAKLLLRSGLILSDFKAVLLWYHFDVYFAGRFFDSHSHGRECRCRFR